MHFVKSSDGIWQQPRAFVKTKPRRNDESPQRKRRITARVHENKAAADAASGRRQMLKVANRVKFRQPADINSRLITPHFSRVGHNSGEAARQSGRPARRRRRRSCHSGHLTAGRSHLRGRSGPANYLWQFASQQLCGGRGEGRRLMVAVGELKRAAAAAAAAAAVEERVEQMGRIGPVGRMNGSGGAGGVGGWVRWGQVWRVGAWGWGWGRGWGAGGGGRGRRRLGWDGTGDVVLQVGRGGCKIIKNKQFNRFI